jgi:transposase
MVRLWVERFNAGGIDALITRPRRAGLDAVRQLLEPVLLEPAKASQVHWTAVKVHGYLREKLALDLGYRTAVRWLHELDFHLRVPRLWPERQEEEPRRIFLEQLRL